MDSRGQSPRLLHAIRRLGRQLQHLGRLRSRQAKLGPMLARAWALLLLLAPPTAVPAPAPVAVPPPSSAAAPARRYRRRQRRSTRSRRASRTRSSTTRRCAIACWRGPRPTPRFVDPEPRARRKVIVSDLHLGPAPRDPRFTGLEDFYSRRRLDRVPGAAGRRRADRPDHQRRLHRVLADRRRARRAAQARATPPARDRRRCWPATRASPSRAIELVLAAHRSVFTDLGKLLDGGDHRVIIIAGNHDADLLWPKVQLAIARAIKPRDPSRLIFTPGPIYEHRRRPRRARARVRRGEQLRDRPRARSAATATAPAACSRAGARCSSTSSTRTSSARCRSSTTSTRSRPRSCGRCATTPIRSATPAR